MVHNYEKQQNETIKEPDDDAQKQKRSLPTTTQKPSDKNLSRSDKSANFLTTRLEYPNKKRLWRHFNSMFNTGMIQPGPIGYLDLS